MIANQTKPQPTIASDAELICSHQLSSGVMVDLFIDEDGEFAGVSLEGSRIDLTEIFDGFDFREFDAAIAKAIKEQIASNLFDQGQERYLDRQAH